MAAMQTTVQAHLMFGVPAAAAPADDDAAGSIINEVFAVAWRIARGDQVADSTLPQPAVDLIFFAHVRLIAEQCTGDDLQRLLAMLLGISLNPRRDKSPLYSFSVAPNPAAEHGLRPQRPSRRRRAEASGRPDASGHAEDGSAGRRPHARQRAATQACLAERRRIHKRLRSLLDGAAAMSDEQRTLTLWVLNDAEAVEADRRLEREQMSEEMSEVTMRVLRAAMRAIARARDEGAEAAMMLAQKSSGAEVEVGSAQDVLRSGVAAGGAGTVSARTEIAKVESSEAGAKRVDEAEALGDLAALSSLLESRHEAVAVKAALAVGALCARDTGRQAALAALGGAAKISSLLEAPFSERGILDIVLVIKERIENRSESKSNRISKR